MYMPVLADQQDHGRWLVGTAVVGHLNMPLGRQVPNSLIPTQGCQAYNKEIFDGRGDGTGVWEDQVRQSI